MKSISIIILLFIFSGCELFDSTENKAKKVAEEKVAFEKKIQESKEIKLQELSEQTKKELAILESKKELAKIEKEKELEKIRMHSELEKQKLILEQEKAKLAFKQQMQEKQRSDDMELKRYFFIVLTLLIFVSGFFTYYYLKRKRQDKLMAYNDNLQKYFHQKENDARVKIAEKMLDTIASGTLNKEQENQLINAFSGETNRKKHQEQLELIDAEIS